MSSQSAMQAAKRPFASYAARRFGYASDPTSAFEGNS
jgi:hypothetical protein